MPLSEFIDHTHGRHGASLFRRAELDALASVLRHRLLHATSMLEIGTYEGVTASLLAEACPQSRIVSVDPFIDDDPRIPGFVRKLSPGRLADWFRNRRPNQWLWVGTVEEFHSFAHHSFDLILVDGSHLRDDVAADLRYSSMLTLPDAVIAVHDYAETPAWPEVREAADAFLASGEWKIDRIVESMAMLRRTRQ